jgi:serpin B
MNIRALRCAGLWAAGVLPLPALCPLLAQSVPPATTPPAALASASNAFACDLFHQIATAPGANVFFSPWSLETALAMTWTGARGDTAAQMAQVLHLEGQTTDQAAPAFGVLQQSLAEAGKQSGVQLAVANSLWLEQFFAFRPEFLKMVKDDFSSDAFTVDYRTQAEAARARINSWVADQTQQRIPNLLQPGDVGPSTRLVLVNAIYFKGNWVEKFDAQATAPAAFTLTDGSVQQTAFMHKEMKGARYADLSGEAEPLQVLALPYKGNRLEFVALLPKAPGGLPALEKSLTADKLTSWLGHLPSGGGPVDVYLPKFKVETRYGLVEPLKALGMKAAFGGTGWAASNASSYDYPVDTDFSGMDGQRDLFISNVVHQAFVEVNEEGTEAAAATGVVMYALAGRGGPTPVFRADHPFLFLIRDPASGTILFLGRLATPAN